MTEHFRLLSARTALGAFLGYKAVKTNKALKEKKADAADSAEEKAGEKD